jgi:DNA-binding response OmpR family regulator
MRSDETRAREAGFDDYLSKPVDPDALDRVLSRLVREAPRPAAMRATR